MLFVEQDVRRERGVGRTLESRRRAAGAALIEEDHVPALTQSLEQRAVRRDLAHDDPRYSGPTGEEHDRRAAAGRRQPHERELDRSAAPVGAVGGHGQPAHLGRGLHAVEAAQREGLDDESVAHLNGSERTRRRRRGQEGSGEPWMTSHGCPYGEPRGPVSGGSSSGCCGRLSVISCQGAFEATKVWYWGRMPGSPSTVPSRIEISFPSGHIPPKRLEPHTPQKTLTAASGAGR